MNKVTLPDGGELSYTVSGDGPPILLLRPLGGSMRSWDRFADALCGHLTVICFDPRGAAGYSSRAPLDTSTRSMARDAASLLDQLGLSAAHVYGISMGGMVASWLAVDAAERVLSLTLASTLPRGLDVSGDALGRGLRIARCLALPDDRREACMATRILSRHFRRERPEEVARIRRLASAAPSSRLGVLQLLGAVARHDARAHLAEIRARTLVLVGEHDPLLTLDSQRTLLAGLHDAHFELVPGAGHDVSVEAPEVTAQAVLKHVGQGPTWTGQPS